MEIILRGSSKRHHQQVKYEKKVMVLLKIDRICTGQMLLWTRAILAILLQILHATSDRWGNKYVVCFLAHIKLIQTLMQYAYPRNQMFMI